MPCWTPAGLILKAADYNRDDVVRPAAILWPDEKREFERLLPRLRLSLPQLLTLGPYDPPTRTGPAIWIRSVLAGKIPDLAFPSDAIPILYLPGVSRSTLRATEDCPPELRPLAELQYRGVFWSQHNGKDWTVSAFLQSERGGLTSAWPATPRPQARSAGPLRGSPTFPSTTWKPSRRPDRSTATTSTPCSSMTRSMTC